MKGSPSLGVGFLPATSAGSPAVLATSRDEEAAVEDWITGFGLLFLRHVDLFHEVRVGKVEVRAESFC